MAALATQPVRAQTAKRPHRPPEYGRDAGAIPPRRGRRRARCLRIAPCRGQEKTRAASCLVTGCAPWSLLKKPLNVCALHVFGSCLTPALSAEPVKKA